MKSSGIHNLTEGKIFSGLLRLALPLTGTSFLQMAYTLMAMAWVGRLGSGSDGDEAAKFEAAIGAIGMLLWLSSSVAYLAMIGGEVSIGQSIGARKMKRAAAYASHTATVAIVLGVIWTALLWIFAPYILSFFQLDTDIQQEAVTFLRIIVLCLPFQFLSYNFAGMYNGAGRSIIPFRNNAAGLLLNMVLDPILMFGMDMGFQGAAVGALISQLFVFALFLYQVRIGNRILGKFPFFIKPRMILLKRVFFLGAPMSAMNSLFAVINASLARMSSQHGGYLGMMAQTVGSQIEGITWNTSQGFSTALSAYVAQNYAANKIDRATRAYIYALRVMFSLGVVVCISFMLFGGFLFGIIVPEQNAMRIGSEYLFIMGLCQLFVMLELTTQGMFTGIGHTIEPAVISIVGNLLRLPLAYFLAVHMSMGVYGVWWAIALSSILKGTVAPIWLRIVYNKLDRNKIVIT